MEECGNPAGLRRAPTGEEKCHGREREATKGLRYDCSSFSPLYIGPRERGGGVALALPPRKGAAREESILPKAPRRCLPLLGLFLSLISWRMGLLGLVPLAHIGQGANPYSPCGPPRAGGPLVDPRTPFGTPNTIPIMHETFSTTKTRLPIYKSLPPDHSGPPRDVRDLIRDSEQHSVTTYKLPLYP